MFGVYLSFSFLFYFSLVMQLGERTVAHSK